MSRLCGVLLVLMTVGCGQSSTYGEPDRVAIRITGSFPRDITLTIEGEGSLHEDRGRPNRAASVSHLRPTEAANAFRQLRPYLTLAEPVTDQSLARASSLKCADGTWPGANDMGGIYLRWSGNGVNEQYWANFNCYPAKNDAAYRRLQGTVALVESQLRSSAVPALHH
jgi:hypothetical protein